MHAGASGVHSDEKNSQICILLRAYTEILALLYGTLRRVCRIHESEVDGNIMQVMNSVCTALQCVKQQA